MANLIIKPASNGSLILQDEGGDAAVTVGTTGSATFAQNATFSGTANAIGTVATGNISNSAIVYPAGHVVRTSHTSSLNSSAHVSSSSSTVAATGIICSTPATTGSNYNIIRFDSSCHHGTSESSDYWALYASKNGGAYALLHANELQTKGNSDHDTFGMTFIDTAGLTAGTNLYQIYIICTSGTFYLNHSNRPYALTVMEIKA